MKKNKLLLAAAMLLFSAGAWAQTDVTSTYITDADFSSTTGWTAYASGTSGTNYQDYGNGKIGSFRVNSNGTAATTDATHLDSEYCLGFECRWSNNYASYYQTTSTLAVGYYKLTFDVQNTNSSKDQNATWVNHFYVQVGETKTQDSSTEWMKSSPNWTTHTILFNVAEAATAKISFGYGTGSNNIGGGNTPVLYVSHLKLEKYDDYDTYLRIKNNLTEATYSNPIVTDFVVNGTFDSNVNGWSRTGGFANNQIASNKAGAFTGNFYENWDGSAKVNKMYQTINNIPNGTYRLDIAAFVNKLADPNESQYVFANDDKTYLTTVEPTAYEVYTVVTTNQIQIGLEQTTATANWMGIDNVSLRYYGAGDVINDAKNASHKQAWEEALAAANAAHDDATYANIVGTEKINLETEIAKSEPSTAEGYDEAAANLISATSTFTAAKTAYDALVTEIAYAETLGVSTDDAEAVLDSDASATSVTTAVQALKALEYTSLNTAYPNDVTTSLLGTWVTGNYGTTSGQGYSGSETYYDKWNASAMNLSSSKTVTLPEGSYVVRVAGRGVSSTTMNLSVKVGDADAISTPFLMIGDTGKGIDTSGAANYSNDGTYSNENSGRGWQYRYIAFTTDGTGDVVITINGHLEGNTWQSFYAPVLLCDDTTAGDIYAGETEYTALNNAIEEAEAKTLGFEKDQYAPYNNVAAIQTLAAAKAIDQTAALTNFKTDVEEATSALTSATWTVNATDVDAIYNGLFATVAEGQNYPNGWTRTNAWGQMHSGIEGDYATAYYNQPGSLQYGNQGDYTMPLAASQAYKLTFSYRSHENNSNNSMTASVLNGEDGLQATTFAGNGSTSEWVEATAFFTTGAAGNYVLTLGNSGNTWVTNVSLVKVTSATLELSDADGYTPTDRTYYETVELTRTIKADTWSTFCVPFNMENSELDASAEVKELTGATLNGNNYTLTFSDASSIVAGKPYMVRVPSKIESISVSGKTISSTITPTEADGVTFTGTYTNGYAPLNSFIISNNNFYLVDTDKNDDGISEVTLKAFRGYITVGDAGVKALNYVFDDDADGISTIENGQLTIDNAPIYNLAGQRIQKMQKGINIVNGHKVLY